VPAAVGAVGIGGGRYDGPGLARMEKALERPHATRRHGAPLLLRDHFTEGRFADGAQDADRSRKRGARESTEDVGERLVLLVVHLGSRRLQSTLVGRQDAGTPQASLHRQIASPTEIIHWSVSI